MNQTDLMSPSKVAEQYGGDKQKIANAVQMGLIDPTVAVMAGMFIDRVRGAASEEQAPRTTVAQDVLAQKIAPAGLQAAAAAPTEGGLAALPVDESMVPGREGYAGGGIIAFDDGGYIPRYDGEDDSLVDLNDLEDLRDLERQRLAELTATVAPAAKAAPSSIEDIFAKYVAGAQERRNIPKSEYQIAEEERLKKAPERAQAAKDRAFWEFVTRTGFGAAASRSPRALQAFGEAGGAATPSLTAGAKEARDIEESAAKGLADMGRAERAEKLAAISAGERMGESELGRESRENIAKMNRESMEKIAREKQTDFQRKWALYTAEAKKRGVEPSIQEFQKLFPTAQSGDSLKDVMKANPYGDPATWFSQAAQIDKLKSMKGEDRAAAEWALNPANKDDPRAKAIRQQLGI